MSWEAKTLGDVCEVIQRGIAPKYTEIEGICVINQRCVRGHKVNCELARRHDLNLRDVKQDRYVRKGDVLVNSTGTGTLGRVAQVRIDPDEPTTVDTHVTIVRPVPEKFFSDFFGYMLIKIEEEITLSGEGASGQTELSRQVLKNNFKVSYPISLQEQKGIVAILDQAFADIEKVRVNTEKNLKNARELFESYLQEVFSKRHGDGWFNDKLGKVCEVIQRGISPKYIENGGVRVINQKCIRDHGVNYELARRHDTNQREIKFDRYIKKGDVLVNSTGTGTLGRVAQVRDTPNEPTTVDSHVTIVRPLSEKFHDDFFGYILITIEDEIALSGEGASGQTELSRSTLKNNFDVTYPHDKKQQKDIVKKLDMITQNISMLDKTYNKKISEIDHLKKSILHKAFTGQLTKQEVFG